MKILCPKCQKEFAPTAVNVEKDTAYCESCQELFPLSELLDDTSDHQADSRLLSQPPPSGIKVIQGGNETVIISRPSRAFLLFLIPFTCVWGGGSMTGIYGTQFYNGKFDLTQSLFGIPFLLGTIVLLAIIITTLFRKIVMKLDRHGVTLNTFCFRSPTQADEYGNAREYSHEQPSPHQRRGLFSPQFRAWKDLKTIVLILSNNHRRINIPSQYSNDNSTLVLPDLPQKRRDFMLASLREAAHRQGVHPNTITNW